jgi:hypothetical protein
MSIGNFNISGNLIVKGVAIESDGSSISLPANTTINGAAIGTGGVGDLLASNNLSELSNKATARTNLGLAIGSNVQAYSTILANTTSSFLTADKTKLDGIEPSADVTDTANVTTAGALMRTGGTMTGNLVLNADPTASLQAATKSYVDTIAAGGGGTALELYAENPVVPTAPSATGESAFAVGSGAVASGGHGAALGRGVTASGQDSLAVNASTTADGSYSFAGGLSTDAYGFCSFAFGQTRAVSGSYSVGIHGDTSAANQVAIGRNSSGQAATTFTGGGAVALNGSYAQGGDSFAASVKNNTATYGATGTSSVAIGRLAKASGTDAVAYGAQTVASGNFSSALGLAAQATGSYGIAIGFNTLASGALTATAIGANSSGGGSLASGNGSVALGGSTSSGLGSFSAGQSTIASGSNSYALGFGATASGINSVALGGRNANADIYGKIAFGGYFTGYQSGLFTLVSDTIDATPEALTTNNSAAGTTNQIVLPNNSAYGFTGTLIAREDSASTNDFAVWEIKGGAVRGATAATTSLGTYNINKISESAGAANWSIALSADTTNGAVAITVTGEAAHNIRWVATINTAEVIY